MIEISNSYLQQYFKEHNFKKTPYHNKYLDLKDTLHAYSYNEDFNNSYINRAINSYLLISSALQCDLFINDKLMFSYGLKIRNEFELYNIYLQSSFNLEENELSIIDQFEIDGNLYDAQIFYSNSVLLIGIFPHGFVPDILNLKLTTSLLYNYYHFLPAQTENKIVHQISEFLTNFREQIQSVSHDKERNGVVAIFYLQNIMYFFKPMGEQFSKSMIEDIKRIILTHLKKGDLLYCLNCRTYITYSPNCTEDVVKKRFENVFFKLNNILLTFSLHFYKVDNNSFINDSFWEKMLVFEEDEL